MQEYLNERWMKVEGYEQYEVSDYGRVRSLDHKDVLGRLRKGKILSTKGKDYEFIKLCKDGEIVRYAVSRLVGTAFVDGRTEDRNQINHKDTNKKNNHYMNLEWTTNLENIQHSWSMKLRENCRGEGHHLSKLTEDTVRQIRSLEGAMSYKKMARLFGVTDVLVGMVCRHKIWKHVA